MVQRFMVQGAVGWHNIEGLGWGPSMAMVHISGAMCVNTARKVPDSRDHTMTGIVYLFVIHPAGRFMVQRFMAQEGVGWYNIQGSGWGPAMWAWYTFQGHCVWQQLGTVSSGKYETKSEKDVEKVGRVEGICCRLLVAMYWKLLTWVLIKLIRVERL